MLNVLLPGRNDDEINVILSVDYIHEVDCNRVEAIPHLMIFAGIPHMHPGTAEHTVDIQENRIFVIHLGHNPIQDALPTNQDRHLGYIRHQAR